MDLLQDPLDSEDFDPVQYINQRFPTEASLDDLDSFFNDISSQIEGLDEEISSAVQSQSAVGKQATKDIEEAQQLIEDLFLKIDDIKVKASQSEVMVQELCADIKKLDYAKNHLQTSITSLNRLQMLINAVSQLEILAAEYQYREAANMFDAVKQFMIHFENYQHISIIMDLNKRVEVIRETMTVHIRRIFSDLAKNIDTVADADLIVGLPGGLRALADACLMVDALGGKVRRQLLEDFVHRQLVPYESLFGAEKEHFSLDQVERRWAWFKRLLKYIDSKFSTIFPAHWRIPLRLCLEFVERTKMHLILLLTEMESGENNDVNLLMKALQSTIRFEQEMSEKFDLLRQIKQSQENEEAAALQSRSKEVEMQKQLKKDDKLMYIPTDHGAANKEEETESGFLGLAHTAISGGLSGVFDKFLGSYVLLERQNLEEMLMKLSQEEDTADGSHSVGHVYASSTNMFVFIKKSVKRCTAFTTGQTFFALSEELRSCMRQYAKMLKSRCPSEIPGNPPAFRLPPGMENNICFMVNTAEYCAEVVPQVEQMIQQKIQPNLASKVNFSEEADIFMDFVAHCLKILVFGVLDRLEPSFRVMQQMNWGAFTQVGEESAYLHAMSAVVVEAIPNIRANLASSYFNNFCTKLATEILQRFQDSIVRQKRITDMATQQLLLDTYSMKTLIMQMPTLNPPDPMSSSTAPRGDPKNVPAMYAKLVNTRSAHIEIILKLVGTPDEVLLERFKLMWPDGQSADLQMIMALKGTKRDSQQQILELLGLQSAKVSNKATVGFSSGSGSTTAGSSSGSTMSVGSGPAGQHAAAFAASTAASAQAASAAAFSSMKSLTQDLSSTARNAVGNLKWAGTGTSK